MSAFPKRHKIAGMWGEALGTGARRALFVAGALVAAIAITVGHPAGAQAARGLELGFNDPDLTSSSPSTQTLAFDRAAEANAGLVIVYVDWSRVTPVNPAGFNPADPDDTGYHFQTIDAAVRDATARGLTVLMAVTRAPRWAEGPDRPPVSDAPDGTWKPDPTQLGIFARALATRYSGSFDGLPAVRFFQVWAEPNLGVNLSPQFENGRAASPDIYRSMLNSFYRNVKSVSPQNTVVTGGTAPYGNLTPAGGLTYQRMQPLTFWRGLLCYSAGAKRKKHKTKKGKRASAARSRGKLIPQPCPDPAHFDVAAHHPINVGAPTRAAINADDISTPDLYKLKRVLRAAAASGRVVPGGAKPLWATEIWWNSHPPSKGLPLAKQARYLEQGFYVLWKQAVQVAVWFEIRDLEPLPNLPIPTSGLFFRDGRPKPALRAYQFPFVTERLGGNRLRAWGEAPKGGAVSIDRCRHRCHHIKTLQAGANRVFVGILHVRGKLRLRATQGSNSSLIWKQN